MRRLNYGISVTTLGLGLALGAGCGLGDAEYSGAPPRVESVTIAVPATGAKANSSSNGVGRSDDALLGQTSEYYQFTYGVSTEVNLGTLELLGLVHLIVSQPSTSQTANSRTWGPYTPGGLDPLAYRVLVTKLAPGQFTFSIDAAPKGTTNFIPLLDGTMNKGVNSGTGKGTMTLHFDNRRTLRPDTCEQGNVAFAFDDTQPSATLDVMFDKFANANPKNILCLTETPHDASYHFDRTADGAGNFVFTVKANIHKVVENKPLLEDISMRSRWQSGGAGRADFSVTGGEVTSDLAKGGFKQTAVTASQCWDGSFLTVYETSDPQQLKLIATDGDSAKCAFSSAQLP